MKSRLGWMIVVMAPLLSFAAGCSGSSGKPTVTSLEGTIVLRGATPNPTMILAGDAGSDMILEPGELTSEMRALRGMRVAVQGEPRAELRDDLVVFDVARYELLRLPSGELPVVGWVERDGNELMLRSITGNRYWIRGDLSGVIGDYMGAKIWVVGSLGQVKAEAQARGISTYWVTGYGVIQSP